MNIWTITWKWRDNSGSGVLPRAYTDKAVAQQLLDVLRIAVEGVKEYELAELEVVDTLNVLPKLLADSTTSVIYTNRRDVPHYGVEGRTPFDTSVLTIRLINALRAENITTLEQAACWTEWQLLRIPNMGRKSVNELKEYLHSKGLALKGQQV